MEKAVCQPECRSKSWHGSLFKKLTLADRCLKKLTLPDHCLKKLTLPDRCLASTSSCRSSIYPLVNVACQSEIMKMMMTVASPNFYFFPVNDNLPNLWLRGGCRNFFCILEYDRGIGKEVPLPRVALSQIQFTLQSSYHDGAYPRC